MVELHDQFMTGMSRRARLAADAQLRVWRRRARDGLERVLGAIETLNAASPEETVAVFRERIGAPKMAEAVTACRIFARLEDRGYLDAMLARYGTLRQYLPSFAALPLQAAAGSESLLAAIRVLRALDRGARDTVETTDPCGFVPAAWRPFLVENGRVDRRIWEIALAQALRDALVPATCSWPRAASTSRSGT